MDGNIVRYKIPAHWVRYDHAAVFDALVEAKASVALLANIPSQRAWFEALQEMELKREVAGTSRIEGAEFTERELDAALAGSQVDLVTRSQRQARAAVNTYRWLADVPADRDVDAALVLEIHRRIITGADDDHCAPGMLRTRDENVIFGSPRHRGVDGGQECEAAFSGLMRAIVGEFREHDPLVQALAAHYHLAAMHPFLDGNGRTARALEALMVQRAGFRDTGVIAMSNYYYDEKTRYLAVLREVRSADFDLTPFLIFALEGLAIQCKRLLTEIRHNLSKELFRNMMYDLFNRLRTPRRRVIANRQIEILKLLLEREALSLDEVVRLTRGEYSSLQNPRRALFRDLNALLSLRAIRIDGSSPEDYRLRVRLEWPTEITETQFFERVREMPKAKTHPFLR